MSILLLVWLALVVVVDSEELLDPVTNGSVALEPLLVGKDHEDVVGPKVAVGGDF